MNANELLHRLRHAGHRLVLAESCTGGAAAALLTAVPGASDVLAGSMVVYQNESKIAWIGVDEAMIKTHTAVSEPVAREMAAGVLRATPHATIAAAITGHLGPGAPEGFDGVAMIATAIRDGSGEPSDVRVDRIELQEQWREARQGEAAALLVDGVARRIASDATSPPDE